MGEDGKPILSVHDSNVRVGRNGDSQTVPSWHRHNPNASLAQRYGYVENDTPAALSLRTVKVLNPHTGRLEDADWMQWSDLTCWTAVTFPSVLNGRYNACATLLNVVADTKAFQPHLERAVGIAGSPEQLPEHIRRVVALGLWTNGEKRKAEDLMDSPLPHGKHPSNTWLFYRDIGDSNEAIKRHKYPSPVRASRRV